MTLSTTNNTQTYVGDNSTVAFAFPFLFFANGDLTVTVDDVTQVLDTDYTVTGAGVSSGGTVTFTVAPITSADIVIQRIVAFVQQTDFENFDGNPADVTEKQFDLGVMQTQQNAEQLTRAILTAVGTTLTTNIISGTIDTTTRALTITTAGVAASDLSVFPDDVDIVLTGVGSGDFLRHDGSAFVNVTEIVTGDIADNAITLAKMAGGTDGNLITYDSSGDPAFVVTGTSGQVLTSGGAGVAPTFQTLAPGLTLLATATASASSSVDFTSNIDSTFDVYLFTFNAVVVATDAAKFVIRVGNGGSFDSGASDYSFSQAALPHTLTPAFALDGDDAETRIELAAAVGNEATEGILGGHVFMSNASVAASFTSFEGLLVMGNSSGTPQTIKCGGARLEAAAHDRVQFLMSAGNITSGEFKLYGVKKS